MRPTLLSRWIRPSAASNRPLIVALHGFFGSDRDWEEILSPFFTSHDICLVTVPGHGKTRAASNVFTFDGMAAALSDSISDYPPSRRILLGYSLGGRLAAYAAFSEQIQVAALGLFSAHIGLERVDQRWQRILSDDLLASCLETEPLEKILSEWYEQPIFAHDLNNDENRSQFIARRSDNDPATLAKALRGFSLGWQPNLWGGLRLFTGPLLYLAGGNDRVYTDIASFVFALHPGRRARILPDVGHDLLGAASRNEFIRERLQSEIAELLYAVGKKER